MFVFGEVADPNQDTVNLVEDIVRSQIIELVSSFVVLSSWDQPLNFALLCLQLFEY